MEYQKTIFNNGRIKLMVNYSGVTDDMASASELECHFYAFEIPSLKQIFHETLDIDNIRDLYTHLHSISVIRDPAKTVSEKFIESSADLSELIDGFKKLDKGIIAKLINKPGKSDKIEAVLYTLDNTELDDLAAAHKQKSHREEIEIFQQLIQLDMDGNIVREIDAHDNLKKYKAGQPEKIFQNWFESNLWIFGVEYLKQHDFRKISMFSEGDLLMESNDGYLDLIELKRPNLNYDIFKYDGSHKSYYPSPDLSKVLGQCLYYLQKLDESKLIIEKEYKLKILRPRIKIVLGRSNGFKEQQLDTLRMMNSGLNHIDIITYDMLIDNGNQIIASYSK